MNFGVLTKTAPPPSITAFRCAGRVDRPKRESGAIRRSHGESNPELPPQLSAASPSSGCHWALCDKAWEGGEGSRPASQETCLNTSSFRRAGRAHGAVFRCGDRGELSSGPERPPCDAVFNVSESSAVRPS